MASARDWQSLPLLGKDTIDQIYEGSSVETFLITSLRILLYIF